MPLQKLQALVVSTGLKPGSTTATAAGVVAGRVVTLTRHVEAADLAAICVPASNYQSREP